MLNIEIQNHKTLRDLVYEELRKQILTGRIVPGTRMMEIELAEEMGVSRTPIREAIRKLEKEGLVTIEPRRGAYASQLHTQDMVDVLEVRQDLEGLAAAFAAERMNAAQKQQLRELVREFNNAVEAGITADMIEYDTQFHHLIVESSDNKVLVQMLEQLQEMVLRFRYLYYDNFKRAEKMPAEHQEIFDAILLGDVAMARAAADVHIERLKEMVKTEEVK